MTTLRNLITSFIKSLDKYTNYKLGDSFIRKLTNINTTRYWDNYYSKLGSFERDFPYKLLHDFLPLEREFSLLDIGCALGDGCQLLKKDFPLGRIEGADFCATAISKAQSKKTDIPYFILNIEKDNPPGKYDFISLVHILEHFNDPFPILDKCLSCVNEAVLVITPYVEKIENPRLYAPGEHRYLFNEHTFSGYKCTKIAKTDFFPKFGYAYIIYRIEPKR